MKKISVLLKYPNPHLLPIFKELNSLSNCNVVIYYINNIEKEKPGYDWSLNNNDNIYKLKLSKKNYTSIKNSDFIIYHGIWAHAHLFFIYFIMSTIFRKTNLVLSESDNIYTINKLKHFIRVLSVLFFNKKSTYYLSLGDYPVAKKDFIRYGFLDQNIFQFGYCGAVKNPSNVGVFKKYNKDQVVNLLYVGQLINRKGVDILINALKKIEKLPWHLSICGSGEDFNSLLALTEELGLVNKIHFKGLCNSEDLEKEYISSDIFVLPSRFDGWGAVLNEAANYSLPLVVSTNVRAGYELIDPFKNGFIFKNQEELSNIIEFMIENSWMLTDMRRKSFEIVDDYKPQKLAKKLLNIINFIEEV